MAPPMRILRIAYFGLYPEERAPPGGRGDQRHGAGEEEVSIARPKREAAS
jgi:hypothetical protein